MTTTARAYRFVPVVLMLVVAALLPVRASAAVPIVTKLSPHNAERPKRLSTLYIILHTTEGPAQGSLQKIYDNGEANYFVDPTGRIYSTIDRRRVAFHSGRSMWKGRTNLDDVSIGIEVAGYYYRDLTAAQVVALRGLLAELQANYSIPDSNVLTHSMVAYGAPNRWHKRSHRGRKRCGMLFAARSTRAKLGLTEQPSYDPDVRAGRLAVGDPYLAQRLYAGAASSRPAPASPPAPVAPPTPVPPSTPGTTVATAKNVPPSSPPPPQMPTSTPSGATIASSMPPDEGDLITVNLSAWDVARDAYNAPDTRYVFPDGKSAAGNEIQNWKAIPPGTRVIVAGDRENAAERVMRIGRDGANAREIAGEEFDKSRTIYFLPDGRVANGSALLVAELDSLPKDTGLLVGYTEGGSLSAHRSAFDVCGVKWNHPSTFYRFPSGQIVPGDRVKEDAIPRGTLAFFRN